MAARKRKSLTAEAESSSVGEPESTRKRKTEPEAEAEMEADTEADPEMEADTEADAEMEADAEADAEMEADSDSESVKPDQAVDLGPTAPKPVKRDHLNSESRFDGDPMPRSEAIERYPRRYAPKNRNEPARTVERDDGDEEEDWQAKCHYYQATIDNEVYNLNDNAYIMGEDEDHNFIARLVEFFEGVDGKFYCKLLWYYRAEDTAIKDLGKHADIFDKRRVFLSEMKNTNELDCILRKVTIAKVSPNLDLEAKEKTIPECELYYDMMYLLPNLTFKVLDDDEAGNNSGAALCRQDSDPISTLSSDDSLCDKVNGETMTNGKCHAVARSNKTEMSLLDLYSGCGAMSTGLGIGGCLSGIKLVTRWAVDVNQSACESLKLNHPEAQVRNETTVNFLGLLKEWQKLCKEFNLIVSENEQEVSNKEISENEEEGDDDEEEADGENGSDSSEVYEVERLLAICYGDPNDAKKPGLYFKVRWKGYDESYDTWEPVDGLSDCKDKLKEFVKTGYENKIIPLPGDVDLICGGPPCQGISGFNRFRKANNPFDDIKNFQAQVYMDVIQFLQPRFTLMENVVDLLKFAKGFLGRYAIGRLVAMNYQCRMGMMAAGFYGVPQYRMRVFLWGAHPSEKLPPYPLPTHNARIFGNLTKEYEDLRIKYDNMDDSQLEKPLFLKDAIMGLPSIENDQPRNKIPYGNKPQSEFEKFISLPKHKVTGFENSTSKEAVLYDHQPLKLNADDLERVKLIPKRKGANYRDLDGVKVGPDNIATLDETVERPKVSSGKPLVPDYALSFLKGKSSLPFGRVWWDEVISTVVTRAEPHNQKITHPEQDRVLSIRELARLQGFPDFYQLCGPIKQRYVQVGNAVAVPVGIALGYSLGLASQRLCTSDPLIKLPFKFPECLLSSTSSDPNSGL